MFLENSILDKMTIEQVMIRDIPLLSTLNHNDIRHTFVNHKYKFLIVEQNHNYGLLTPQDVLEMDYYNRPIDEDTLRNKLLPMVNPSLSLRMFLETYGSEANRYYGVIDKHVLVGYIDKKKIITLNQKEDEDNKALITSILDNINDAICIVDINKRVKFWNIRAEKLYGLERHKILDQVLTDYFPGALLPRVIESEQKISNVHNEPRKGAHNLTSASPLYNNNSLIGAISYDKDISEQIKIAEDLKVTESNLEVLQKALSQLGESRFTFDNMVGEDASWVEVMKVAKMVSKSMINILISGESGTGKELLARAIHTESGKEGYFVPINCSAIPANLFESELFGYAAGAFSGASSQGKVGKFEFATHGTIFLDEIGDMPLEMQAKLLRVLEDGEVIPVGGNKSIKVDVRIIAASNMSLLDLCNENKFRKDLYYRLNGIGVTLPPLRERRQDISLLVDAFLEEFKGVYGHPMLRMPDEILCLMTNYDWEGNIRELRNIVERLVILSKNHHLDLISDEFLPDVIRNMAIRIKVGPSYALNDLLERTEREAIQAALNQSSSKADAAKLLKIPRSTLYFKMDKYNLRTSSKN